MSQQQKFTSELSKIDDSLSGRQSIDSQNLSLRADFTTVNKFSKNIPRIQVFAKNDNEEGYHLCKRKQRIIETSNGHTKKIICKKNKKNSHDDSFYVKNQTKDRNVMSNLIHHLVKYLINHADTEQVFVKIISEKKLDLTFAQFLNELEGISSNLRSYVTINHIKDLWFNDNQQKQNFNLVMRIMSRRFYSINGLLSVFYSNKFNDSSKNIHIKGARSLIEILKNKDMQKLRFCIF